MHTGSVALVLEPMRRARDTEAMLSPNQPLATRTALVTGGASGIGLACARALQSLGAVVTVADRPGAFDPAKLDGLEARHWEVDLLETAALESAQLDFDILVNNAGVQHVRPIHEFEPEQFRRMLSLMVEVPFLLTRAVLPQMYQDGFGRIINVSSIHGLKASAFKSAYVSAKHGLEGLSKVIALEGAEHGVTSNCVNPGYVRTPLVEKQISEQAAVHGIPEHEVIETILLQKNAIKRLVEPAEVAALVGWLASDAAAMVTGASYTMDGGWTA